MNVQFQGYTAITRYGSVDLVPFLRRLGGDKNQEVPADEQDAAVVALHAAGIPTHHIADAVSMSYDTVRDVLAGNRPKRRGLVTDKHAKWLEMRERRLAERVLVDGFLVHPRAPHGEEGAYQGYGCRCVECRAAHAAYRKENRRAAS